MVTALGLVAGLPVLAADKAVEAANGSDLTQILTVSITGFVSILGALFAWDSERRRRKVRAPDALRDMRETIADLRHERDDLRAELREVRQHNDD